MGGRGAVVVWWWVTDESWPSSDTATSYKGRGDRPRRPSGTTGAHLWTERLLSLTQTGGVDGRARARALCSNEWTRRRESARSRMSASREECPRSPRRINGLWSRPWSIGRICHGTDT